MTTQPLPSYRDLPQTDEGVGSGWGIFGPDDSVGLVNLLSPDAVARAAHAVQTGQIYPLDIRSDFMTPPLFQRGAARLTHIERLPGSGFDDVRDNVYSQSGSQWDALSHVAYRHEEFYNGATAADVKERGRNTIDHWGRRGIAGRGVLLDVSEAVAARGTPGESIRVTVDDLERARLRAGIEYETGDIVLLHTGFLDWYAEQPPEERQRLSFRDRITAVGIENTEAMAEYLWDSHVAAFLADNAGVEVMPPAREESARPFGFLHRILIGQFGMAIGELWWTGDLARACRADGRYDFLFVSAPQNVPGAAGSPSNALAIR